MYQIYYQGKSKKQRLSGVDSIFAVASVDMAKLYYVEFKRQMAADPSKRLRVAIIYSYGANEAETDGILDEENSEDTSALDQSSRDFLEQAIQDYNEMLHINYDTSSDKFPYIETALQAGEIKTTGIDIDRLMSPVSRFGGGNRVAKKRDIIDKLKTFFDKFFGIV